MKTRKTIIIAEAGVNHNGDIENAKLLVKAAAMSGANFVKFQSFKASKLVSPEAKKATYQIANTSSKDGKQLQMLKELELSHDDHLVLIKECERFKIKFLSTAFDVEGIDYLNGLGVELFKIPSGEITNLPYLEKISSIGKPVILSTGMANMDEINSAFQILRKNIALRDITILHCTTEYPTPMKDVNLNAMNYIRTRFKCNVGYSDHTLGIEVPIAAVALGATVVEKHFTLNRKLKGPDHAASLEPDELIEMVKSIKNIEYAISGNGIKVPSESEMKNISIARKSIHLIKSHKKGHVIQEEDLIALRPGDGISPMDWHSVIGRKILKNTKAYHKLDKSDFL